MGRFCCSDAGVYALHIPASRGCACIHLLLHSIPAKTSFWGSWRSYLEQRKSQVYLIRYSDPERSSKQAVTGKGRDYRSLAGLRAARHGRLANRAQPPGALFPPLR